MSQAPDQRQKIEELLKLLVEQKIISAPQADIARADSEVTGMAMDEVLIARRWVTEDRLYELAPWMKQPPIATRAAQTTPTQKQVHTPSVIEEASASPKPSAGDTSSGNDFDDNLRKYRELMDEILGDANK